MNKRVLSISLVIVVILLIGAFFLYFKSNGFRSPANSNKTPNATTTAFTKTDSGTIIGGVVAKKCSNGAVNYPHCNADPETSKSQGGQALSFLKKIQADTGLNYKIVETLKDVNIAGAGERVTVKNMTGFMFNSDINIIMPSNYFLSKGMSIDGNNSGDATLSGQIAYNNNELICILSKKTRENCISTNSDCTSTQFFCADLN